MATRGSTGEDCVGPCGEVNPPNPGARAGIQLDSEDRGHVWLPAESSLPLLPRGPKRSFYNTVSQNECKRNDMMRKALFATSNKKLI